MHTAIDEMKQELAKKLAAFEEAGGRGVGLADEIDALRRAIENAENPAWEQDDIQFPRLLSEIRAAGLTDAQYDTLCREMDLDRDSIDELLERAEAAWARIKRKSSGDYCEDCVEMDHEVCWFGDPDPNCRCCLATLAAIEAAEKKE